MCSLNRFRSHDTHTTHTRTLFVVFVTSRHEFARVDASFCFRRSSVGTFIRQPTESSSKKKEPPPKLDYRSMVSVEDKPDLFASIDSKYFTRVYFVI